MMTPANNGSDSNPSGFIERLYSAYATYLPSDERNKILLSINNDFSASPVDERIDRLMTEMNSAFEIHPLGETKALIDSVLQYRRNHGIDYRIIHMFAKIVSDKNSIVMTNLNNKIFQTIKNNCLSIATDVCKLTILKYDTTKKMELNHQLKEPHLLATQIYELGGIQACRDLYETVNQKFQEVKDLQNVSKEFAKWMFDNTSFNMIKGFIEHGPSSNEHYSRREGAVPFFSGYITILYSLWKFANPDHQNYDDFIKNNKFINLFITSTLESFQQIIETKGLEELPKLNEDMYRIIFSNDSAGHSIDANFGRTSKENQQITTRVQNKQFEEMSMQDKARLLWYHRTQQENKNLRY